MLELLLSFICEIVAECFQVIVDMLMPLLSFNFETFVTAFPYAADSFPVFQGIAIGIVLLLAAFQLLPFFTGSLQNKSSPIRTGGFVILAILGIYYGNYILVAIMEIAQKPFDALLGLDGTTFFTWSFAPISNMVTDTFMGESTLLYIIVLILIGIAFIKLLLEAVERYCILFVLVYLSPLAASSLASEETSGICKRFFTMFFSQCLLLVLNVWSLKMVISMFSNIEMSAMPVLTLFLGYAFLRIAAKMDSYLNQIGLNAAVTGIGLGGELMASGMMLLSRFVGTRSGGAGSAGGDAGGAGGGVLGAANSIGTALTKVSPFAGVGKAVGNTLGAAGHNVSRGVQEGAEAAAGSEGSLLQKMGIGISTATRSMRDNIGTDLHDGWQKTQNQNFFARSFGGESWQAAAAPDAGLTEQHRADISANSAMAARAFNAFNGTDAATYESADVAAVMAGTGIEKVDPSAGNAIDVGYGNVTTASNLSYSLDANGLTARYDNDGKTDEWSIKNATQYNTLPQSERVGYVPYKDSGGNQYYYRHGNQRLPNEAQQQKAVAEAELDSAFTQLVDPSAPNNVKLSPKTVEYMKSHPGMAAGTFNRLLDNGNAEIPYNEETQQFYQDFISSMRMEGVSPKIQNAAAMAAASGEVNGTPSLNSDGFHINFNYEGKEHDITVLPEHRVQEEEGSTPAGRPTYDMEYMANRGYARNIHGGNIYYTKHDDTRVADENNPGYRRLEDDS